jgi:TetR/AcrR family transcriptional regulator
MSYVIERRQEEKERRRSEILDAAEIVFAKTGVANAKMDDVARSARVSRALLYLYFPDKESLHFAISERALVLLKQRFSEAVGRHKTGLDQIEALGRAYLAFSQEFPVYFAALSSFQAHKPEDIAADSIEHRCILAGDQVHLVTAAAIRQGIQDGSIRADVGDPHVVAIALWAFLFGVLSLGQTKANMLARDGIQMQQLMQQAMVMCGRSLASKQLL